MNILIYLNLKAYLVSCQIKSLIKTRPNPTFSHFLLISLPNRLTNEYEPIVWIMTVLIRTVWITTVWITTLRIKTVQIMSVQITTVWISTDMLFMWFTSGSDFHYIIKNLTNLMFWFDSFSISIASKSIDIYTKSTTLTS